ncbi:hypothetical protein H0O01_03960 [Candidatus Micrarchaeota archaeon]|nr:hypothetical protein [Candidatus Micrarchaeota archaeon]
MKKKLLRPNQIITLRDYPVYNEQILKIYFRVFQRNQGRILPPCPVIHKSIGIPKLKGKDSKTKRYNRLLTKYLEENPHAEYFLLDGGHKTAAATLSHKLIPVLLIERNQDFNEAKQLISNGELFGWYIIEKTVKAALKELAKHHFGTEEFLTVKDKVKKMIKNKDVPRYMISAFKRR